MIMLDNTWKLIYRTTHKPNTEDNSKNFAVVLLKAFIHSYIECNDSKIITEHIFYKPRNECYAAFGLFSIFCFLSIHTAFQQDRC